jgi:hypothetical protein|tara:strand:- start:1029 stop:1811 length:783 start_codon:yes stop_codon:yes gene_type:complete
MNNIFVVKTVDEKPKEGRDKFRDQHVWDIFWQCKRLYKKPFKFHLLTNFTTVTHPEINVIDVSKYKLDGWWNKMLLFHPDIDKEGTNLYFDLDVTLHREITNIDKFIFSRMITCVYCFWKPVDWLDLSKQPKELRDDPDMRFPSFYNTSVMGWKGGTLTDIWKQFDKDADYIMTMYRGNDDYLGHEWSGALKALPRKIAYSYYYGADTGSEFFPRDKQAFKKRENYYIRLLNGPGKDEYKKRKPYYDRLTNGSAVDANKD